MKVKALKTFCGVVNMTRGEVRDIPDSEAVNLVKVGYVQDLEEKQKKAAEVKATAKTTRGKK